MSLVAILTTAVLSIAALPKPPEVKSAAAPAGGNAASGGVRSPASQPLPGAAAAPPQPREQVGGGRPGLASWYVPRPSACWDAQGRHSLPAGLTAFTAARGLPCGTLVTVSGPAGSITVPVFDHGPESWTGRVLDLSPAAFEAVAGSLGVGVANVAWRPAA